MEATVYKKTIGDHILNVVTLALWPIAWLLGREFVLWTIVVVLIGCIAGTIAEFAANLLWLLIAICMGVASLACNFARILDEEDEEDEWDLDNYNYALMSEQPPNNPV